VDKQLLHSPYNMRLSREDGRKPACEAEGLEGTPARPLPCNGRDGAARSRFEPLVLPQAGRFEVPIRIPGYRFTEPRNARRLLAGWGLSRA
jgi:hypothetical protein